MLIGTNIIDYWIYLMLIENYKKQLAQLCRQYHVAKLYLFGSVAKGTFAADRSDIDIIVQFEDLSIPPEEKGQLYWDLLDAFENLFERKVDLLVDKKFANPYFRQAVENSKKLIYDRSQSQEVFV